MSATSYDDHLRRLNPHIAECLGISSEDLKMRSELGDTEKKLNLVKLMGRITRTEDRKYAVPIYAVQAILANERLWYQAVNSGAINFVDASHFEVGGEFIGALENATRKTLAEAQAIYERAQASQQQTIRI